MFYKKNIAKILLPIFAAFLSSTVLAQPKVSVPETVRQMGIFHQDETIKYDFVIRNEGDAPLKIADVKASCSCTVAEFDKEIAPGKLGRIHTKINVSGFEGPISKNITVLTNDADKPELTLTIRATVVSWITVKPGFARFSVLQGETGDALLTCVVASSDGTLFKILRASSAVPGVAVSYKEATETQRLPGLSGNQWAVNIQLNNSVNVGPISDYVILTTDHPRQKEIKIPLSGIVRPAFRIEPSKVDLGQIIDVKDVRKYVIIRANSLKDMTIHVTAAEATVKGINVSVKNTPNKNENELEITADPSVAKGVFNGKIIVHTSNSFMPGIEVELKGEVL